MLMVCSGVESRTCSPVSAIQTAFLCEIVALTPLAPSPLMIAFLHINYV
jgi:hypothetical protein